MADVFDKIVTDEHMSDIADAIRELLGPDSGLTILDFPQKIRDIKAVDNLVEALCWRGSCEGIAGDVVSDALTWR